MRVLLLVMVASGALLASAAAEVPLVETESVSFHLGGYAKNIIGYQHLPYDTWDLFPDETAVASQVGRLEWGLSVGDWLAFELHDRLLFQLVSESGTFGTAILGLGVSAPPGRTVDLSTDILEGDDYVLEHDVDRLALRLFFPAADLTLGRQAISWGNALLFPVADLFTQLSPFELDTTEKRGVDAVRVLTSPGERLELDFVVADKGSLEDLSGGLRANFFFDIADVYIAGAKLWNEVFLFAGLHADLETVSLRVDGALPFDLDEESLQLPRVTTGLDYFAGDLVLSVELHLNGAGAAGADDYLRTAQSEPVARGEVYLLGRYYLGVLAGCDLTEFVNVTATVLANLGDPSLVLAPALTYLLAENADLSLGAYFGIGAHPIFALPPALGSEFGSYGQFYYSRVSAYF